MPSENLTKRDVADRQLDRAIAMYWDNDDPLLVMTMARPAHVILRDLAEDQHPTTFSKEVWLSMEADGINKLPSGETIHNYKGFIDFLHAVPNSAQHANKDTNALVTVHSSDAFALLVMAIGHAKQLEYLTPVQIRFLVWATLQQEDFIELHADVVELGGRWFPGLNALDPTERLAAGRKAIASIVSV